MVQCKKKIIIKRNDDRYKLTHDGIVYMDYDYHIIDIRFKHTDRIHNNESLNACIFAAINLGENWGEKRQKELQDDQSQNPIEGMPDLSLIN